jgi:uncharacterized lipoprotein
MPAAHRLFVVLLVSPLFCLGLAACSSESEQSRAPAPVKDEAYEDMARTMDKARAVEDTTMQHTEDLDRALDAAESGH